MQGTSNTKSINSKTGEKFMGNLLHKLHSKRRWGIQSTVKHFIERKRLGSFS